MGNESHDPRDGDGQPAAGGNARSADDWAHAARARADRLHQRGPVRPPPREPDKAWYRQLPAKMAGTVVFLVALTTLLGNLLELRDKGRDVLPATPAPSGAPATPGGAAPATGASQPAVPVPAPAPAAPAGPVRLQVALDRIAVDHDGSLGTTDWRFTVEADGQPLLAFEQDDLDDTGGRNVVRPKDVSAGLRVAPDTPAKLEIRGWRLSRFRMQGEPDATGEAMLAADGGDVSVPVRAKDAAGGAFVFYFQVDRR